MIPELKGVTIADIKEFEEYMRKEFPDTGLLDSVYWEIIKEGLLENPNIINIDFAIGLERFVDGFLACEFHQGLHGGKGKEQTDHFRKTMKKIIEETKADPTGPDQTE